MQYCFFYCHHGKGLIFNKQMNMVLYTYVVLTKDPRKKRILFFLSHSEITKLIEIKLCINNHWIIFEICYIFQNFHGIFFFRRIYICMQWIWMWQSFLDILQFKNPCSCSHERKTIQLWHTSMWKIIHHSIQVKLKLKLKIGVSVAEWWRSKLKIGVSLTVHHWVVNIGHDHRSKATVLGSCLYNHLKC